jgi:hypothetical protein
MAEDVSETDDLESRWPKDGDRLFVESEWAYDAHIVRHQGERFYRMPMGYKRAGDILVDQAATDVVDRRNVIYAALFCYRQFIELSLKHLIEEFGQGKVGEPRNTHDLSRLWERFMSIANKRGSNEGLGLEAAARLVAEMHEADHKADGFRFPTGTDGAPFAFGDRGIDLANLREVMQGLGNFLECAYLEFEHQDDLASDAMIAIEQI